MNGIQKRGSRSSCVWVLVISAAWLAAPSPPVCADAFHNYHLVGTFSLPDGAGPFDLLSDGRIITLIGDAVYIETALGSRSFSFHGALPDANIPSFGAAFVRVSPDGSQVAVGDNDMPGRVGIFDVATLSGTWFASSHFSAAWYDAIHLALSGVAGNRVSLLDTTSPDPANPINPLIIDNTGVPGGIAFDVGGNLYTGNGFGSGPISTGEVRVFDRAAWTAVLAGAAPLDFLADGILVVDILSGDSLGFDREGNLHVGGGDFFGGTDTDFAALVRASSVNAALMGQGPADPNDPEQVRRLDPDVTNEFNFYSISHNPVTNELYLRDFGDPTVYVYNSTSIPTASAWGMTVLLLLMLTAGTVLIQRRPSRMASGVLP